MNIFDLLESPGMGRPRDTNGVQSAADQSAASVIGSGTTKHEDKKKPVTMMGKNVKEAVEEAVVKPNFKMPPESLQDKMYRQHQELRKKRGAPSAEEYKERIAQKQKEIDALKEGILDRAVPKMPKPRNPANAVLGNKVNAAGKHLDKKRRQELNPKHKHQDPLEEGWKDAVAGAALAGSIALGGAAHAAEPVVGQGQSQNMQMAVDMAKHNARVKYLKTVHGDNFQDKQMPDHRYGKLELKPNDKGGYVATIPLIVDAETQNESLRPGERHHFETDPVTGKRVYKGIRGDQQDAPQRAKDDPAARADQERKAHIAHDRGLTEQAVDDGLQLAFQGYKIKFTPSQLIISKGADVALTRPGDFSNPTKQQISTAKRLVDMMWQKDKNSNQVPNIEHQHELYALKKEYEEVKSAMEKFLIPYEKERRDIYSIGYDADKVKALYNKYYNNPEYKDLEAKSQSIRARLNVLNKGSSWKDKKQDVAESQAVKITDYDTWSDEVKELGGEIHTQRDRNLLVAQSWDGEEIGKFHLGKSMGFINRSGDLDETIRKMGSQYRLLSKKGKNLGTFDTKAGAEKHEREVQYFKHKNMEEGWKGKLAGAALAGAAALGGGDADAQQIDLPGPQVSYVAHVSAEANGREVHRTMNLGNKYSSEQEAYDDIERSLQAKGITRYNINIEQKYDAQYYPGSNQPRGGTATGKDYGTPGIGDMVIKHIGREIRAGIPSKGGYATGGTNRGERPRDGSQWWRDQLPQMREDELAEDIESHLYLMSRAGYDIVQEEWSDKYKDSINCSDPKGFSQKAHCAGKKKNEDVSEEKVRLDPKCWSGKKIGNPKTKMKGGVRVNNCVPK